MALQIPKERLKISQSFTESWPTMAFAIAISVFWDAILAGRFGFWTGAVSMLLSFLCMKYAPQIDAYLRKAWGKLRTTHIAAFS